MVAKFGPEHDEDEVLPEKEGRAAEKHILQRLAEMAEDLGVDDLAEQHDHYLYGVEKVEVKR